MFSLLKVSRWAFVALCLFNPVQAEEGGTASPSVQQVESLELVVPGELSVATEASCPPYSMLDQQGHIDGLEFHLFSEIAKRLNLTYKPVVVKWDAILIGLQAGRYDVVSTPVDITAERQKAMLFADSWLVAGGRVLTLKNSPITTLEGAKGKTMGVVVSSTWEKLARDSGITDIKPYKSTMECVQGVANGDVDGALLDGLMAIYAVKQAPVPMKVSEEVAVVHKGFVLRMDQPHLAKAINKVWADMLKDGTYERITTAFLGYDPRPKEPIRSIFK